MKKYQILFLLTFVVLLIVAMPAMADLPPDPGGGGPTGTPVGGGSPLGGGLLMLAFSALIYGVRNWRIKINAKDSLK